MVSLKRKAESELALAPDRPLPRKNEQKPQAFTSLGIAARVCAVIAFVCMFLPWVGVPGLSVLAQYSWMIGLYIAPIDYIFPMYSTGEVTSLLGQLTGSNLYSSVWAVFLMFWAAGALLLLVRFIQSLLGFRETRRLVLAGFISGGVAIAWIVAVILLNQFYATAVEATFGLRLVVFTVQPAVVVTAVAGIASAILAKKSKR